MDSVESKIINGKVISETIKQEVAEKTNVLKEKGVYPHLAVILVGDDPGSQVYVRNKEIAAKKAGLESTIIRMSKDTQEEDLLSVVDRLNKDAAVHGILVQLPLPKQINEGRVIIAIDPAKDVDGFHPFNVGKLFYGDPAVLLPCTPAGIIEMLDREKIELAGKKAVIIGRSNIVGKPMFHLLLKRNATVKVCHSRTVDLKAESVSADILVVAIGRAKMIDADYVKPGAVVIDVGMNRDENDKLCGDVDFESVAPVASRITPVPRGVGPMTIAMLLKNTLKAAISQNGLS